MQTDRFRTLVDEAGPFATVYYDDSHNTEDASRVSDLTIRALLEELTERGADDALKQTIETALTQSPPPSGSSGRAVIAGANGVVFDEHLVRPAVKNEVRVSELPYLVPLVEHGSEHVTYAVVLVDHEGADIGVHRLDASSDSPELSESVDGGGHPVHKASGAENAGYGDPQPRAEEAARKNLRAAADGIENLVDGSGVGVVFVGGDDQARAQLHELLSDRVRERTVDVDGVSRSAGGDSGQLAGRIDEEFAKRRLADLQAAVERFQQDDGTGRAAQGLGDVTRALRAGNVETLIVGDLGERTVAVADAMVAPDADTLADYGVDSAHVVPADEALPAAAIRVGAAMVRTDERFAPEDGIAAVLRFDEFSSADSNEI